MVLGTVDRPAIDPAPRLPVGLPPPASSWEGDTEMALLPRITKVALSVFVLFALTALTSIPTKFPLRALGSWLAAAPAWAGGSPDETLNPRPKATSIKYKSAGLPGTSTANENTSSLGITRAYGTIGLAWSDRVKFAWRLFLASKSRYRM